MLKAKLSSHYRKTGGLIVFVYIVIGSVEELAAYATAQGVNFRKNEAGQPLFFSSRLLSTNVNEQVPLVITQNGRVVVNDIIKVAAQEAQLEYLILQEKAKLMAQMAVGRGGIEGLSQLTSNHPVATEEDIAAIENAAVEPVEAGNALPV